MEEKKDGKLLLVTIIATAALVIAALILGLGSFSLPSCGNTVLHEHLSPDGLLKAVVFERNCGATTGFSTQVTILGAREDLPDEAGNLFVADTDHGAVPAGAGGGPEVRLDWRGKRELLLRYHANARLFKAERSARGVSVRYSVFKRAGETG